MERKNKTLGWKSERAAYSRNEKIFKDSWVKQTEEWKGNDRTTLEAFLRSSTPFKIGKSEPFIREYLPQIVESITVGLNTCQIAKFRGNKNESF